jgi:hypothetical protein
MIWPAKVSRSTMAAQRPGSVKVLVQPEKGSLEAIVIAECSGDLVVISPYLGQTAFDRAIADFAKRYAVQNQRDYLALPQAIDSGRLAAEQGV